MNRFTRLLSLLSASGLAIVITTFGALSFAEPPPSPPPPPLPSPLPSPLPPPLASTLPSSSAKEGATSSSTSGLALTHIDPTIRPQDDLYNHANGAWLNSVAIPPGQARWGIDELMHETTLARLRELLEQEAPSSTDADARKAAALFASFKDAAAVEALGAKPLRPMLDRLDAIENREQLSAAMAELLQQSVRLPIAISIAADSSDANRAAVYIGQSGVGLADRDDYLLDEPRRIAARNTYRRYIGALLAAAGDWDSNIAADRIVEFETQLAKAQWTRPQMRDVDRSYNPIAAMKLAEMTHDLFGPAFLNALGIDSNATLVVEQPSYIEALGALATSVKLSTWKAYLRWQLVAAYAPYLSDAFVNPTTQWRGRMPVGIRDPTPRWKRGVQLVDQLMGDALGKLYVVRHFSGDVQRKVESIAANIVAAFKRAIEDSDWLSTSARADAQAKLAKLHLRIGHPQQWRSYAGLQIDPQDLIGNVMRVRMFNWRSRAMQASAPVDRGQFRFSASTNNALYNQVVNAAEFPAGLLQPPMVIATAPDAYNYGAIGATIGHEIMHGFDEQGSRHDGTGRMAVWWRDEDRARFSARANLLVTQFEQYEPMKGVRLDGRLTLRENLADLAGVEIAYSAYRSSLGGKPAPIADGYTGDQLFFMAYAQSLSRKQRSEAMLVQLKSDSHAPPELRVNGIVSNLTSFQTAFDVKPGDRLYRPPEQRVQLWR